MKIIQFLLCTIFFAEIAISQEATAEYLSGNWQGLDSSERIKLKVRFKKNGILTFPGRGREKWKYSFQFRDSIIDLKYTIVTKRVTLQNEGVLIIQNANCFWWFHPEDYLKYDHYIKNGDTFKGASQFEDWLRERREVYYRVQ